jgi:hypothetical protein
VFYDDYFAVTSPDSQTAIQKWQTEIQKRLKRGKLRCKNSASGANRCAKMRQKAVQAQRYETGDTTTAIQKQLQHDKQNKKLAET